MFSEDFYASWGGILGDVTLCTIPRGLSFPFVFGVDILFVTVLIMKSGGVKRSPLTSVLLLRPTLAIFLHEPRTRFLIYSGICAFIYSVALKFELEMHMKSFGETALLHRSSYESPARQDQRAEDWAVLWGNLACLALATLIGFITAPRS